MKYNKTTILKKFKGLNTIKKTILNYRTNEEIKKDFIISLKNKFIDSNTLKPLNDNDIKLWFKETETLFIFNQVWVFKNKNNKTELVKNLSYDVNLTTIKDYDKIKGEWFKTNFAKYEEVL